MDTTIFHPWIYLLEEIQERWLTQSNLAYLLDKSLVEINNLIKGKRNVTVQRALLLEAALDIPAHIRLGLQKNYDLRVSRAEERQYDQKIKETKKRAREFALA